MPIDPETQEFLNEDIRVRVPVSPLNTMKS